MRATLRLVLLPRLSESDCCFPLRVFLSLDTTVLVDHLLSLLVLYS